ncbi:hypothetical protein BDV96DRAFT_672756 [Lophiotrema nucula]|uniref:Lysine-specific metallo-endopeptidase domain-containing protein n=1 Tax=Lophiotrema nucula TaxID=690887 RepID=A0A6A5YKY9_9PLEO|nr:hypothetical protein BDV96DRAFT_672756 [Lophiotrema nucula]
MWYLRASVTIVLLSRYVSAWWTPTNEDEFDDKTFYIDGSCKTDNAEGRAFANGWLHALGSSHAVIQRLASQNDRDFHAFFKRIMKRTVSDPDDEDDLDEIMKWFEELALLRIIIPPEDLASADIRVFCDNEPISTTGNPNTRLVYINEHRVEDRLNFMAVPLSQTCLYSGLNGYTATSRHRIQTLWDGRTDHGQKKDRMVISLCKRGLEPLKAPLSREFDLSMMNSGIAVDYGVRWMFGTAAHLIVHELMHALSDSHLGDLPDPAQAYGWHNVEPMNALAADQNADSYAFVADAALLAPLWTLTRIGATAGCPDAARNEDNAKKGRLRHYADRSVPKKREISKVTGNETEQSLRVRRFLEADPQFVEIIEESGI